METNELEKLQLRKLPLPEWKKFWKDRGFTQEMETKGIIKKELPQVTQKIFHVGPYFMVVVDYRDLTFDYVHGTDQMLGIPSEEFYKSNLEFLVNQLHPEDREKVMGLAVNYYKFLDLQPIHKRLDFKVSVNLRVRKADGEYMRVLEQVVTLNLDSDGRVTHVLKYFTDISHLNYSDEVVLSIFDDKGEQQQEFYTFNLEEKNSPAINDKENSTFSKREQELISMVALGKTSKEIAATLGISANTVNKHRENMMRKTGSKNMNEVISFAYCNEYL